MRPVKFNLDHFLSISGRRLVDSFAELVKGSRPPELSDADFASLVQAMESMDNQHLVYAMELCRLLRPEAIAAQAAEHLSNQDVAVACAAHRVLDTLPPEHVTPELIDAVACTPIVAMYCPDLDSYGLRPMGTNRQLVQILLDKWTAAGGDGAATKAGS